MTAVAPPFLDARRWESGERRSALVTFDDVRVMFTALWDRPSSLVPRPDGSYRRRYLVNLLIPNEYRERSFHEVRSVALYLRSDQPPLCTEDIGGVNSRDLHSVTLAMFIDDWQAREPQTATVSKSDLAEVARSRPPNYGEPE